MNSININNKFSKKQKSVIVLIAVMAIFLTLFTALQSSITQALAGFDWPEEKETEDWTINDFEQGYYDCMQKFGEAKNSGYGYYTISTLMGPEAVAGGGHKDSLALKAIDMFDPSLVNYDTNITTEIWNGYYGSISFINTYLDRFEVQSLTSEQKEMRAEVKMLRAMLYFDLNTMFGTVPFSETGSFYDSEEPWYPIESKPLMDWITQECKESSENLPIQKTDTELREGCITKDVALFVSALACLNKGPAQSEISSYEEARATLKQIIDCGRYRLTPSEFLDDRWLPASVYKAKPITDNINELVSGYRDYKNDEEAIYMLRYNTKYYSVKNKWQDKLGIRSYPGQIYYPFYGTGAGLINIPAKFVQDFYKYDGEGSYRLQSSLIDYTKEGLNGVLPQDEDLYARWSSIQSEWRGMSGIKDAGLNANRSYGQKKYGPINFYDGRPAFFNEDYKMISFDDVIFLYAFASWGVGNVSEALTFINLSRERASLSPLSSLSVADIANEIVYELCYTGNTYRYLMMLLTNDTYDKSRIKELFTNQQTSEEFPALDGEAFKLGTNFTDHIANGEISYSYLPIPQDVIDFYDAKWEIELPQNIGWVKTK